MEPSLPNSIVPNEIRQTFIEHERQVRVSSGKIACALVFFLMPLGVVLDHFVYREKTMEFLMLRLLCSLLVAGVWALHYTKFARNHYPFVGLPIVLLPALFITIMIYQTEGADSPYYAGLNLILLAVSAVGHWSLKETLLAVGSVIVMYMGFIAVSIQSMQIGVFFNNIYFQVLTGIIVVTGNHFFNKLRFREFALRCELDENRKALETSLRQLKENEAQLVQSEKLASLGRMSAGIIHEINNPLNFAITGLFTLKKKSSLMPSEKQAEYTEIVTDIEDGVKRVQAIVSDLRTFTHPGGEMIDEMPAADILTQATRFLSNELRDRVQIEQSMPAGHMVYGNKNKLIQVMVNLMQNSIDALSEKTFNNGEKPTIWIEGRVDGGRSYLSVRDNGPGIEGANVGKVFDPFFTTKDVGQGMGLGLSVCYQIMQQFNGRISVKTEVGKFCEFTLEFPAKG